MDDVTRSVQPTDPVMLVVEFGGWPAVAAFFGQQINMLNVLSMWTTLGGLPGMPDEQEHPNVQVFLEFRFAELAHAWSRVHLVALTRNGAHFTVQKLRLPAKPVSLDMAVL